MTPDICNTLVGCHAVSLGRNRRESDYLQEDQRDRPTQATISSATYITVLVICIVCARTDAPSSKHTAGGPSPMLRYTCDALQRATSPSLTWQCGEKLLLSLCLSAISWASNQTCSRVHR